MSLFKITKLFSNAQSLENILIHNKHDFNNKTELYLKINGGVVYKSISDNTVEKGFIGMNGIVRNKLVLDPTNDNVMISEYKPVTNLLHLINIKMTTFSKTKNIISLHEDEIKEKIKDVFRNHLFSNEQVLLIKINDRTFVLHINIFSEGYMHKNTDILLFSDDVELNLIGSKLLKRDLFRDDYNFEEIGIGGLDKQLINVFRRALSTRAFKPTIAEKLGIKHVKGILLYGPPGCGKCLGPEEQIIMFNGELKMVKDIKPGDIIMGDDSTPRNILSICSGMDKMYRIVPTKGEPFIVNEPHILSLKSSIKPFVKLDKKYNSIKVIWLENGDILSKRFSPICNDTMESAKVFANSRPQIDYIDIPLNEYIKKSNYWKANYKGYRVSVDWPKQDVPFDPYMIGVWLGDGSSYYPWITNIDEEIISYCKEICEKNNLTMRPKQDDPITYIITKKGRSKENIFNKVLQNLNLIKNKHIPQCYKTNNREVRLQVLAGLLDSDGYLTCNCYEIVQKNKTLAEDICFLARSLGFYVSNNEVEKTCTNSKSGPVTGIYQRIYISGEGTDKIPVKCPRKKASKRSQIKNTSHFGFKIESLGMGQYCGFTIDGNRRFLLKDFTVTHNTLIARKIGSMITNKEPKVINGPEIMDKYVGQSEQNIRNLFSDAKTDYDNNKENSDLHVIIFDEIDAICKRRGSGGALGSVGDSVVNQLLSMIDGVQQLNNIFIVAMTNRKELLDEALLRAGRIEIHIEIGLPDLNGRKQIFRVHTNKMQINNMMDKNVDIDILAKSTENYSGAEIEAVVKNAGARALHEQLLSNKKEINENDIIVSMTHFLGSIEEISPAFGNVNKVIKELLPNNYLPLSEMHKICYENTIDFIKKNRRIKTILIYGENGTGKTTLATKIALDHNAKHTKIVKAIDMVSFDESMKSYHISSTVTSAYVCEESMIILDDIEIAINYAKIGNIVTFSNKLFQTLVTLLKTEPTVKSHKLTLLVTCGDVDFFDVITKYFDMVFRIGNIDKDNIENIITSLGGNIDNKIFDEDVNIRGLLNFI